MHSLNPRSRAGIIGLLALALVACGGQTNATPTPASASPSAGGIAAPSEAGTPSGVAASAAPSIDVAAASAYSVAMCPIFDDIVDFDPRLAALRQLGAEGADVADNADELNALADDLGATLDDLEAVPEWSEGAELRFLLINALHTIRVHLVRIAEDPEAAGAADSLAETPFVASPQMDRAMSAAIAAGLVCGPAS